MTGDKHRLLADGAFQYPCAVSELITSIGQNWTLIVGLLIAGVTAGIAAGLFGIGGGVVIVPVLHFLLTLLGYESTAMHVAVSTSLATIIVTSLRSVHAHHQAGAVDWSVLRWWSPWIVLGAILGMLVAEEMSARGLTLFFGGMALLLAAQFVFGRPSWRVATALPEGWKRGIVGTLLGIFSAMMGIGGGVFGVTLMTLCGRSIHTSVATAAGFGVAIGLPGAITAMVAGYSSPGLPPGSVGFVNLPAFVLISLCTVTMAPVGARLAHSLDGALLRRLFGLALCAVAIKLLV